jgi:hypothetical protein
VIVDHSKSTEMNGKWRHLLKPGTAITIDLLRKSSDSFSNWRARRLPCLRRSERFKSRSHIDDRTDNGCFREVCPSWIAEPIRDDPESFDLANCVLDTDTKSAEALVVLLLRRCQHAAYRLLIRMVNVRMLLVVPLIHAVSIGSSVIRQLRSLAPDRQIVMAAGMRG